MGGMMSQTPTPTTTASSMLPYYGVLFAVIIAVTIVGVIGVAYYLVYPQIRMGQLLHSHNAVTCNTNHNRIHWRLSLRISLKNPNRGRTQNHHSPPNPQRQIPAEIHQSRNRTEPTANTPNFSKISRTWHRFTGKNRQHQPSRLGRLVNPKTIGLVGASPAELV